MQNRSVSQYPAVVHAFKKTNEGEVFVKQQVIFNEKEMDDFREKFSGHIFRTVSNTACQLQKKRWWKRLFAR